MGWIDSTVCRISPKWAYKRETWRQAYDDIKNYDAGNYDKSNANWRVINESAEMTDKYSRDNIRGRARDLERNSDMLGGVIKAFKRNVMGNGFTLQAKTNNEELNTSIESFWKEWCKKENCDVTGTQSFNQMLRMAIQRKKVDGGIIFLKRYTSGGLIPFKLQAIEVDELDSTTMIPKTKGNRVVGGIEYNSYNKPVGYYIRQYSIDGLSTSNPVYVDAKDVIFIYTKQRPSQIREMSDMAPTITRIRDANEYMVAVSLKERIGACLAVFIKKVNPSITSGRNGKTAKDKSYDGKTITPGMIKELNAGDEIDTVNPSGQATDATNFIKLQQRLIGSGQGLSYEATSRDMSEVNYSSARQGGIEDELTYTEDEELILGMMSEIYETFVISLYLTDLIKTPKFWERKKEFLNHEWVKSPKKWIDPMKEANANKIALQTGQKTFKQIAAENGRDWKEQIDEMCEVLEYAKQKGIEIGGVIYGKSKEELYGTSEKTS